MGVPTSEVGYIPAMPRREDYEVHKDMWGSGGGEKKNTFFQNLTLGKKLISKPNACPFLEPVFM